MSPSAASAPPLQVSTWLNTAAPVSLAGLRGRAIVVLAFQMLCPGCVQYALPQIMRLRHSFAAERVAMLGLHAVFEHHAANSEVTLAAFLHEYRIDIPVGIDAPDADGGPIPRTMAAYAMQGTPTLLLIDPEGRLRHQFFGHVEDIALGAAVAMLAAGASGP